MDGLQIMRVREAIVSSILPHSGVLAAGNKNRLRVDMANDTGEKILISTVALSRKFKGIQGF